MADESQQPANGNAASDTGPLDTNQAAAVFANLLSPPDETKKDEPAAETEAEKPEVEAEAEGAAEEGEEKPEKMFTVKDLDGNDIQISESELINGYKAQKASTQKFEAAAALRKEAEAQSNQARTQRQQAMQAMQQAEAVLAAQEQEAQNIDFQQLLETDPVEYLKQQHLAQARQAKRQQNWQNMAQLAQIEQQEQAQAIARTLVEEKQALLDKIPAWKDEAKASTEQKQIVQFLMNEMNYPQEVVTGYKPNGEKVGEGIIDHRAILMARESMLYRQMMSKAQAAAKKVSALPQKVERPGVADSNQGLDKRTTEWNRFAKSGKVEDAAAIFSRIL